MKTTDAKHQITIEYAHCVKWTDGQLDVFPHSAYEMKLLRVAMVKRPLAPGFFEEEWECVILDEKSQCIGEGETPNEAIADAQYFLMNESRNVLMIPHAKDCACLACARNKACGIGR